MNQLKIIERNSIKKVEPDTNAAFSFDSSESSLMAIEPVVAKKEARL
jgi:hypothetical protein